MTKFEMTSSKQCDLFNGACELRLIQTARSTRLMDEQNEQGPLELDEKFLQSKLIVSRCHGLRAAFLLVPACI